MELINKSVIHKKFGKGVIIEQENSKVIIEFNDLIGNKVFQYPEGFERFLKLNNEILSGKMNDILQQRRDIQELEDAQKLELLTIQNRKEIVKSCKTLHKKNIAIKCNFCDGGSDNKSLGYKGVCSDSVIKHNIIEKKYKSCCNEESLCQKYLNEEITRTDLDSNFIEGKFTCNEAQTLNNWRAYSGIVKTGMKKSQSLAFHDLSKNMLGVLTTRLPGTKEKERIVFAVFLVMGRCDGDEDIEGYIGANPDYRIELNFEQAIQIKFWNYYFNEKNPEVIRMGSGLHHYITDDQAVQILNKIIDVEDTDEEKEYAMKFLEYFCEVKEIDRALTPEPEGGLIRI